jgi:hypothetical protein
MKFAECKMNRFMNDSQWHSIVDAVVARRLYYFYIIDLLKWNGAKCAKLPQGAKGRGHDLKSLVNLKEANCLMEMGESLLNWGFGTLFSPLKMYKFPGSHIQSVRAFYCKTLHIPKFHIILFPQIE